MNINNARYLNQSILRALQILETFTTPDHKLSIPDISKIVGLHRSTVHRLVLTLESAGWLTKVYDSEKYVLGIKLAMLSKIAVADVTSSQIIRPLLEELAQLSGETVVLTMVNGDTPICIDKIESSQILKISSEIGQKFPLFAGATGFAVLIGMSESEVKKLLSNANLERYTEKTITDPSKLLELYYSKKSQGYVISSGYVDPGVTGIAAPIFFAKENSYGSIGVTMPENRATKEAIADLIDLVLETAQAINNKIGFVK